MRAGDVGSEFSYSGVAQSYLLSEVPSKVLAHLQFFWEPLLVCMCRFFRTARSVP